MESKPNKTDEWAIFAFDKYDNHYDLCHFHIFQEYNDPVYVSVNLEFLCGACNKKAPKRLRMQLKMLGCAHLDDQVSDIIYSATGEYLANFNCYYGNSLP